MADMNKAIKQVAMAAVNESEPATFLYGTVTSVSPLQIQVEQKLLLSKEFLVLTKNVINYEAEIEIDWSTESETCTAAHEHKITGKKKVKVLNALKSNDKVILLKQQGGQMYLVIDRVKS
ncbi:uncharacterized protein DUF2577 [Lachnotalea glycerini]|uniref:Uncharacterized protein DUF2577 n=1 Tax=Lachnotalea glycerini TaxID=1763509 RepID=A0A318ER13_9FIRM|nr:DUF2577 domain-containing protein [Lachnotalea glycerini]OYO91837.1 hypothetical protein CG709_12655 [Lachnotalea glycerini]PXV85084.1 uncharacterized protein DUF2577 [Lachnotalea glycerini]